MSEFEEESWPDPYPETPETRELDRAIELFHLALDAGPDVHRAAAHGRAGDWVDGSVDWIVEALLAAGWKPPSADQAATNPESLQ